MLNVLPQPTIFAHRGASAHAPENTLSAFKYALHQEADVVEMDVKLTADGKIIVFHDQTLDRITCRPGLVKDFTLAELRQLDVGSHFDVSFRGETIPTLDEVFKNLGEQCYYNIELTNYVSLNDSLPEKVAQLTLEYNLKNRLLFSSFNPIALIRIRRQLPGVPIALLARPGKHGAWARSQLGHIISYQALHIAKKDLTKTIIERIHKRGRRIHVFTLNREEDIRYTIGLGVDGIFTNNPAMAKRVSRHIQNRKGAK